MPQESITEKRSDKTGPPVFISRFVLPLERLLWPVVSKLAYSPGFSQLCVELGSICNANCVFCPYRMFPENRKKAFMPDDIFNEVLNQIKITGIKKVMLSPDLGEPTLAPGFIDKIKALRGAGIKQIELTTNAIALHRVGIDNFLESGPDIINISTTGFDAEMFKRIYRCRGYEKMRENVLELLEKNSRRSIPRIINIWLRVDIPVQQALRLTGMETVGALANDVAWMTEVDSWNGRIKQDMLPGRLTIQNSRQSLSNRPCRMLLSLVVRVDGGVHACSCRNIENDPDLYLGSLGDRELQSCYRKLDTVVKRWKQGALPGVCKGCDMYHDPREHMLDYGIKRVSDFFYGLHPANESRKWIHNI